MIIPLSCKSAQGRPVGLGTLSWLVLSLAFSGPVAASVPTPLYPQPVPSSVGNAASVDLRWSPGDQELILNGGFETGNFEGWIQNNRWIGENQDYGNSVINSGTLVNPMQESTRPASGSYHATFRPQELFPGFWAAGAGLQQLVSIPANATSATLRWVHRLRNYEPNGSFGDDRVFAVLIMDENQAIVDAAYFSEPGEPLLGSWTKQSADLTRYRGRQIQLAFVMVAVEEYMEVHLDDVSLRVQVPEPIIYDVYFGTNTLLGQDQLLGSTTQTEWALPGLEPDRTYFWRLISRQGGNQSIGPVWQFTTRKMSTVDHFEWGPLSSPQAAGQPFTATLTARDAWDNIVTNFQGAVRLKSFQRKTASPQSLLGSPAPSVLASHDRSTVGYAFTPQADLLVERVRHYSGDKVSLWTDQGVLLASQSFPSEPGGGWQETILPEPVVLFAGRTYRVGVYSGLLITNYARFDGSSSFAHGIIHQSYESPGDTFPTVAHPVRWWFVDLGYAAVGLESNTVSPGTVTEFVNGVWSGELTVTGTAGQLFLRADDGRGHAGLSDGFAVAAAALDSDGDGMPDSWEQAHGLNPADPSDGPADADGDGASNRDEYRAGTDPNDSQSAFRITAVVLVGDDVQLSFAALAGRTYRVERSVQPGGASWGSVGPPVTGTGGTAKVTDPGGASRGRSFYRVTQVP